MKAQEIFKASRSNPKEMVEGLMKFYENPERTVKQEKIGEAFISTMEVIAFSNKDYETAIAHPNYNNGKIVIVEEYETREKAVEGHEKWKRIFSGEELPDRLIDRSNCLSAQMIDLAERILGGNSTWRKKEDQWPNTLEHTADRKGEE